MQTRFPWMETLPQHLPVTAETPGFLRLTSKFSFQDVLLSVPNKFHGMNVNFQRLKKALEKESTAHWAPFPLGPCDF